MNTSNPNPLGLAAKNGGLGGMGALAGGRTLGKYDWRTDTDYERLCAFSPQIALARYYEIPFAPSVQIISATFTNATDTIGPFSLGVNAGNDRLGIITVVDQMNLSVYAPNLNTGNAFAPLINFFYGRQTGVTATMLVDGQPRYAVATDPIPVEQLVDMFTESWPDGWVLTSTQIPKMSFATTTALPAPPVTFNIGFRMWQPISIQRLTGLTDAMALRSLVECGAISEDCASRFCI